jgi:hypothetical protein
MNAFLNPTLLFGVLLSIGYAAIFHLWTGRTLRDLSLYLLASLIGFGVGQWAGQAAGLSLLRIGQLYILETTIGAFLALLIVRTFYHERSPS